MKNTNYPNYEIIIIHNASKENSKNNLTKNYPDIRYYYLPKNLGFGRANNIGIRKARGKYIQLLNTDTLPQIQILEKRPDIGIVGTLVPNLLETQYKFNDPGKIFFIETSAIAGSCMLFPRSLVLNNNIGQFDPYIFFFAEDTDLSYRFWLHGYRVVRNPNAVLIKRF